MEGIDWINVAQYRVRQAGKVMNNGLINAEQLLN